MRHKMPLLVASLPELRSGCRQRNFKIMLQVDIDDDNDTITIGIEYYTRMINKKVKNEKECILKKQKI